MAEENNNFIWPGWETVRLIGRGSYGAVYEIQRDVFGYRESAALKIITIPQNDSEINDLRSEGYDEESITDTFRSYLQNFINEYTLMSRLSGNANIVGCHDVKYIQHSDRIGWDIYIRMELLTPLMSAFPVDVSEDVVLQCGRDLCRALQQCESFSIVHRDIKPQNIFVSKGGDFKLGDFGIAKVIEGTNTGSVAGTYRYMAPEVARGEKYGASADIYSLGLVLYWMLNKRRLPFLPLPPARLQPGEDERARSRRLAGEPFPSPLNGSDELKRVVLKACAFRPAERYHSASEMLRDIEDLIYERKRLQRFAREEAERKERERLEKEETERTVREKASRIERERIARQETERKERERLAREEAERKERERVAREEEARKQTIYNKAVLQMSSARTDTDWLGAAQLLEGISGWRDADRLLTRCRGEAEEYRRELERRAREEAERRERERIEREEQARKQAVYNRAVSQMNSAASPDEWFGAAELLKTITGFRNADRLVERCRREAAESERKERERLAREEAERKERERLAREEAERKERERLAKEEAERKERERLAREEAERRERERKEREESERKDAIYDNAISVMSSAATEADWLEAAKLLKTISGWKDADGLIRQCRSNAEKIRRAAARKARAEAERKERERLAREKAEREERERLAKIEAEHKERERIAREEAERKEHERLAREEAERRKREEAERKEKERLAEETRKQAVYNKADRQMSSAKSHAEWLKAAEMLESISGWKDSDELLERCRVQAEECRQADGYRRAKELMDSGTAAGYKDALKQFQKISGYKDSDKLAAVCREKIRAANGLKPKKLAVLSACIVCLIALIAGIAVFAKKDTGISTETPAGSDGAAADLTSASAPDLSTAENMDSSVHAAHTEVPESEGRQEESVSAGGWTDIVAIAAGDSHTVGLRSDGTVVAVGDNIHGGCDVGGLTDIVAIAAGKDYTIGLRNDGTAAIVDNSISLKSIESWTDIIAIDASEYNVAGVHSDGTVIYYGVFSEIFNNGQGEVEDWTDITAVAAGWGHTVGLRSDGTVVAVGTNSLDECRVSRWNNIIAIDAGGNKTVGLRKNGTVVTTYYVHRDAISKWTSIVAIALGGEHVVGLRSDGTVVAVGDNSYGQCDVKEWSDIIAISAGKYHTVGLRSDGTVVAVGDNSYGQCDVEANQGSTGPSPTGSAAEANASEEKEENPLASAEVGSYITFGSYEQDNNTANGKEPIEWLVLAKENGRILVVSRYALDGKPYNMIYTRATWETCSLRQWLNGDFLSTAFSEDERAMIPSVTVSADKNPRYTTDPGNSTTDQVFLLSITEANKYFRSDEARKCAPTDYAIARRAWESDKYKVDGKGTCWWWLRSPGYFSDCAVYVDYDGSVLVIGITVDSGNVAVRPAMWIELGS